MNLNLSEEQAALLARELTSLSACLKSPRRNHSTATGCFLKPKPAFEPRRPEQLNLPHTAVRNGRQDRLSWVDSGRSLGARN
jgi:hypothetical protein